MQISKAFYLIFGYYHTIMSKNVLLTGGPGFIGHQAVKKLLKETDWQITVIDRLSYAGDLNRIEEVILEVGEKSRKRLEFIFFDLKSPFNEQIIKKLGNINYIVHIGASSHVNRSVEDPSLFIQDNIVGTFNLLEAARKFEQLELFYYFSTDEVFGPSDKDTKFQEWDRYNSKNPYAATKAAGEELTIAFSNTYSIPALISHCCNVYGERQHFEKFIPNTIKKVLNGDKVIIHTDENDVPGSRYYLHNEDLAETILFLLNNYEMVMSESEKNFNKKPAKVNITGNSLVSNLEVVQKVESMLNKEVEHLLINNDPERPGHDIKYGLDNSFLKQIGGEYDRGFESGMEQTVSWFLNNKKWLQ